jgi:hypothetical protein
MHPPRANEKPATYGTFMTVEPGHKTLERTASQNLQKAGDLCPDQQQRDCMPLYCWKQDALSLVVPAATPQRVTRCKYEWRTRMVYRKLTMVNAIELFVPDTHPEKYAFEDEMLYSEATSSAEYESMLIAWRQNVLHDLVRPTTVIKRLGSDI